MRTGPSNDGSVFIEVANSGPVIPGDLVLSLFEPFRRIEERTSAHDSAGLGPAIVNAASFERFIANPELQAFTGEIGVSGAPDVIIAEAVSSPDEY